MRTVINVIFAAAALIATPALAETKPGAPAPVASAPQEEGGAAVKDKRYCVQFTTTGSRVPKRTCLTRAQWIDQQDFDPLAPQK